MRHRLSAIRGVFQCAGAAGHAECNEVDFKPATAKLDERYGMGCLDKTKFFDDHLEPASYELWHHEGRRARMGAMMMAPD